MGSLHLCIACFEVKEIENFGRESRERIEYGSAGRCSDCDESNKKIGGPPRRQSRIIQGPSGPERKILTVESGVRMHLEHPFERKCNTIR